MSKRKAKVKAHLVSFLHNGEVVFMDQTFDEVMARAVCVDLKGRGFQPTHYKVKVDPQKLLAGRVLTEVQS